MIYINFILQDCGGVNTQANASIEIVSGKPICHVILTFSKSVGIAEKAEKRLCCIGARHTLRILVAFCCRCSELIGHDLATNFPTMPCLRD